LKWTWSAAESELDFPRWAALCRQRDICPPADFLIAAYLGWERPVREMAIAVDNAAEDAAFDAVMREFSAAKPQSFTATDLTGDR
jgi:hypothetical protein